MIEAPKDRTLRLATVFLVSLLPYIDRFLKVVGWQRPEGMEPTVLVEKHMWDMCDYLYIKIPVKWSDRL